MDHRPPRPIFNEREFKITTKKIAQLRETLQSLETSPPGEAPAWLVQAQKDAHQSLLEELQELASAYEQEKTKDAAEPIEIHALEELPGAFIRMRVRRGYTQRDLAQLLNVKEQQVQRDEENLYAGASLERMARVGAALGVRFVGNISG
jgi:hypothetical protein